MDLAPLGLSDLDTLDQCRVEVCGVSNIFYETEGELREGRFFRESREYSEPSSIGQTVNTIRMVRWFTPLMFVNIDLGIKTSRGGRAIHGHIIH